MLMQSELKRISPPLRVINTAVKCRAVRTARHFSRQGIRGETYGGRRTVQGT